MQLWIEWYECVQFLRPACSHYRTYMWMVIALAGFSIRTEYLGVTSIARALGLEERYYERLLHMFHSNALNLDMLTSKWIKLVKKLFCPLMVGGFTVFVVDGLKIAKEGKKMPSVKKLHQESNDNSKPEYIFGHSFQVIAMLVKSVTGAVYAIPLVPRIHEGVVFTNRDKRTLMDKMVAMFDGITSELTVKGMLVADSYYANKKIIIPLIKKGMALVSRVRWNAVGYHLPEPKSKKGLGRPPKYGEKVKLIEFFNNPNLFSSAVSPVYGEDKTIITYYCINLLWRPIGRLVRFVLVDHPARGRIILICSRIDLEALDIIALYGYRFKIEVSFKHALHVIHAYAYHFWMKAMTPISRKSGNQHLHKKSKEYRDQVRRKIKAYHLHVQLGAIVQGILLHLSINFRQTVWASFRSWLRTMNKNANPSEFVVTMALRSSLPEFLAGTPNSHALKKFIAEKIDLSCMPEWLLLDSS